MHEELSHLPNYTCLETITRFHKDPAQQSRHLEPLDTVGLEIIYSNHREWYGLPGDRNFSIDNLQQFVGGGVIGTGAFAMILHNIHEAALITYRGPEDVDPPCITKKSITVFLGPWTRTVPGWSGSRKQSVGITLVPPPGPGILV